ncbi:MAG: hypothetical protein M3457_22735 [Chloroflexota bacterium]|nr:hypothetical protein [Chloroflexota bacterium]
MALIVVRNRIIICLLLLLSVAPLAPQSGAAQSVFQPTLTSATTSTALPDSIVVSGSGFTPGGLVYIALYDRWGATLHETRWVIAGESIYQPTDSTDPGLGFESDGNIREAFEIATAAVYGPNGSQDPAQGYVAGDDGGRAFATACDAPLMVRAFDQRTASWSNLLDVEAACGQ